MTTHDPPALFTTSSDSVDRKKSRRKRQLGRCLTSNSTGVANNNHDNSRGEYILFANDVIGKQSGRRYRVLDILGHGTFGQVAKCHRIVDTNDSGDAPSEGESNKKRRLAERRHLLANDDSHDDDSDMSSDTSDDDDNNNHNGDSGFEKCDEPHDGIVAVKVVKNRPAYLNQGFVEIQILELLNQQIDPHDEHRLVRLQDYFIFRQHLCLVFELLSVNLYELVKQNQFRGLSLRLTRTFVTQLLKALAALARANIIHCDLKPENILLESLSSPRIKLIDFGSACFEGQTVYSYIQSRFYRSPEVLLGVPYTGAIDLWSLGCIAAELFLGLPLFPGASEYDQTRRIVAMRGLPPPTLLRVGKNTHKLMARTAPYFDYRLKTPQEYTASTGVSVAPPKRYLKHDTLDDLIALYPYKRGLTSDALADERQARTAFVHLLKGLLNVDPGRRWSAVQASQHPFVLGTALPAAGWRPPKASRKTKKRTAVACAVAVLKNSRVADAEKKPPSTGHGGKPRAATTVLATSTTAVVTPSHHDDHDDDDDSSGDKATAPSLGGVSTSFSEPALRSSAPTGDHTLRAKKDPAPLARRPSDEERRPSDEVPLQRSAPIAVAAASKPDVTRAPLAMSLHSQDGFDPSTSLHGAPTAFSYRPVAGGANPSHMHMASTQSQPSNLMAGIAHASSWSPGQQYALTAHPMAAALLRQDPPLFPNPWQPPGSSNVPTQGMAVPVQQQQQQQQRGGMPIPGAPFSSYVLPGARHSAFIFGSPPTTTSQPRSYQQTQASPFFSNLGSFGSLGSFGAMRSPRDVHALGAGTTGLTPSSTPSSTPGTTPNTPKRSTSKRNSCKEGCNNGTAAPLSPIKCAPAPASSGNDLLFQLDDEPQSPVRRVRSDTNGSRDSVVGSLPGGDDFEESLMSHLQIGGIDVGVDASTPPPLEKNSSS